MPIKKGSSRPIKGKFNPPRWRVFGEIDGVAFSNVFRSEKAAVRVANAKGVVGGVVIPLH
jgi:hypothetical protein